MIGLVGATALVTSGMVGAGVFIMPAVMGVFGTWSIIGWLVGALMAFTCAVIFGRLNKIHKGMTASECIAAEFGDTIGFLSGLIYFAAMTFSGSCIAITLGKFALPLLGINVPAWVIGYTAMLTLLAINFISFGSSMMVLIILTIMKVLFLGMVAIFGVPNIVNYTPHFGPTIDVFKAAAVSMFAFLGLEFAFVASGNVKDPEINVPRSTYLSLLLATVIFVGVYCATVFTIPNPEKHALPVYDAVVILFGQYGALVFSAFAVLSCFATLNGIMVVQASGVKTAALRKWINKAAGAETSQHFPWIGAVIFAVFALFIMSNEKLGNCAVYVANSFVGMLYLMAVLSSMKRLKLDLISILALCSSVLIIGFNTGLITLQFLVIMLIIGYIIRKKLR